jgi:hypothetical protein
MPLEVRELVVKVDVGTAPSAAPRAFDPQEVAALKREIIASCLAEVRRQIAAHDER